MKKLFRLSFLSQTAGCVLLSYSSMTALADMGMNMSMNMSPGYNERKLVSDLPATAMRQDTRLVNPWGVVAGPGLVWVNDNGTGLTTAYGAGGGPVGFSIQIPSPSGGSGTPTGLVANNTGQFLVTRGPRSAPSTFLMATEDGTITAWNHSINGSNAVIVVDHSGSGAVYKGLAIAPDAADNPRLFAANFHARTVDVFDGQYNYLSSFMDSEVPDLFAPFNIRTIHGRLVVAFAMQRLPDLHDDQAGPGNGFIDIFDTDGTLLRRVVSHGALNSPWGLAEAPVRFGKFSRALLVGNFGDGKINGYDLLTGKWLGNLANPDGSDLVIEGLWGLTFDSEPRLGSECNFDAQRLYFTEGLNDEADGVLGTIRPQSPFFTPAR
jgi:uncharacterized protein (TIGR03118 family)